MQGNLCLRPGVTYGASDSGVKFRYLLDTFELEMDTPTMIEPLQRVLSAMDGTATDKELQRIGGEGVIDISQLAEVLTGQHYAARQVSEPRGVAGTTLAGDLFTDTHYHWFPLKRESTLSKRVLGGEASHQLVIGFVIELFHVTVRAHDALAPACVSATPELRPRLEQFFREEYRHDKLLRGSLRGLGLSDDQIDGLTPLPGTITLMNALATWARTDTLSFVSVLSIFEGTSAMNKLFRAALQRYDLPEEFVRPQLRHMDINEDESHHDISGDLLAGLECVAPSDARRARANARLVVDMTVAMHEDVERYYGNPASPSLRTLDAADILCKADLIRAGGAPEMPSRRVGAVVLRRAISGLRASLMSAVRGVDGLEQEARFSRAFVILADVERDDTGDPPALAEIALSHSLQWLAARHTSVFEAVAPVVIGAIADSAAGCPTCHSEVARVKKSFSQLRKVDLEGVLADITERSACTSVIAQLDNLFEHVLRLLHEDAGAPATEEHR